MSQSHDGASLLTSVIRVACSDEWFLPKDPPRSETSKTASSGSESKGEDPEVQDEPKDDEDEDSEDLMPAVFPSRKYAQAALKKKEAKEAKESEVGHTCDS